MRNGEQERGGSKSRDFFARVLYDQCKIIDHLATFLMIYLADDWSKSAFAIGKTINFAILCFHFQICRA